MRMTVDVCDLCQSQGEVRNYRITQGDRAVGVDLCPAHANMLESLMSVGGQADLAADAPMARRAAVKRQGTRRSRGIVVTPMSAIEHNN